MRLRKSEIPNPKLQIPISGVGIFLLGFGIWVLGFGIFVHAQEGRGGRGGSPLGAVGALGGGGGRRAPDRSKEPTPHLPDGTISLNGLWVGGGPVDDISVGLPKGEKLPLLPAAVKVMDYRAQHESDDPHLWCMPMGVPRSTPYPFKFVQDMTGSSTSAHLYILHEGNIHSYRQVFMDGRKHPAELDPTWFGHSIGRWENKDTLVIDTVGFNDKFWFDRKGTPHSEQLHIIERWTRPNMGTLTNAVTIEDPMYYSKPFTVTFTSRLQGPNDEILENICQENNQYGPAGGHDNPFFGK